MDVSLRCRCGNVGVHLREPPKELDRVHNVTIPPGLTTSQRRLGCADLASAFHRVPELVRATERAADEAKWRCYECRICNTEMVYACRHNISSDSAAASSHHHHVDGLASSPAAQEILTEGILVNLELLNEASLMMVDEKDRQEYSHAFKVVLPHSVLRRSTDISKLLGAAGVTGLKLFERLTNEVDSWLSLHLRDLTQKHPAGCVTKEQEHSLRKQALRERDALFAKVCQENGIGSDLVSLARAAETLASAISKGELLADNDLDEDYDFEGRCEDLVEFKERHGHCRVPRGWRENVELSNWVRNLRRKKIRGTLSSEKIAKLEELGFVWRKERKDSWEEHFLQLIEFNERFGHCRVSRNWKENVKLGQWVQSLRRLKLSGRLSVEKIARLESIGFEWRLRQKEDGLTQESQEGEAYDGESDLGVASSGSDFDEHSELEEDQPSWLKSETKRWHNIDISLAKDHSERSFAYHDGLRAPPKPSAITAAATTTKYYAATRNNKGKARLPSTPTFSLNDIDEDNNSYGHIGPETHGYLDDDDDDEDDAEFDAVLDDEDEAEDDDWEGINTTSRSKRKRAIEKKPKSRHRRTTDQRPASSSPAKTGVRACMECGATKTPHWRRGPSDEHGDPAFLCNACGLRYYKTLQQKPSAKKSKKRSSPKKQKTHREHDLQDEAAATRETANKKTTKTKKPTTVAEAVTDSDSESREGIAADEPAGETTALRNTDEVREHCGKEDATRHEDIDKAGTQAAGAENAHVPWLLAFKQKWKDQPKLAPASTGQPTPAATTNGSSPVKEEDDEIFDFVE